MEGPIRFYLHLNDRGCIDLSMECPLGTKQQSMPVEYTKTSIGFTCLCGADIPLHTEALMPVEREIEALAHCFERSVALAI